MRFTEKLDFLMKTFNSSNSKLAKAINVDPSLVSKWRNGSRSLSSNSPYIQLIADYFLNIDSLQQQKDILLNCLRQYNSNIYINGRLQLKTALIEWLYSTEYDGKNKDIHMHNSSTNRNLDMNNLLSRFAKVMNSFSNSSNTDTQSQTEIHTDKGETINHELYKGKSDKQQIVINIINTLLTSEKPIELLFHDEASMKWLVEDKEFIKYFSNSLKQLVAMGHKITVIHYVNRNPAQIASIMDFWIPLYLTGCVESYYFPKYTENAHKKSMCVARDKAVIFSISMDYHPENPITLTSTDPILVKLAEDIFMSYLSKCRKLSITYKADSLFEYYEYVTDIEEKLGSYYTLKNRLPALTMPPGVYSKLLDTLPLTQPEKEERLKLHHRRIEAFKRNIPYYKYVEIFCIDAFEKFCPDKFFRYNGLEFFYPQSVECEPDDFIEHLTNMIQLMYQHENYEVILIKSDAEMCQNTVSISAKEDSAASIASYDCSGNNPIAITTQEDHVLMAFESYLKQLADYVPESKRQKESVIKKLEESISKLKKWNRNPKH